MSISRLQRKKAENAAATGEGGSESDSQPFYLQREAAGRKSRELAMTSARKINVFSATVAVATLLAWFTGTNHCLLGLVNHPQNAAIPSAHCPHSAEKSGEAAQGPSKMLICCQGLQCSSFQGARTKVAYSAVLVAVRLFAVGHLFFQEAPESIQPQSGYNTGPPAGNLFVRTVLRRALCENAPPLLS